MSSSATDNPPAQLPQDGGDNGGANSNLFSDPNQEQQRAAIPKTIARPPEQHDYGKELEETQKQYRSAEEERVHQIQEAHRLEEQYTQKARGLIQNITEGGSQLDQTPDVPVDPEIQKQIDAYKKKEPDGRSRIFGLMMMGLALGVTAFGWRRGYGARNGIMQGWASAVAAFNQNKKEAAQNQVNNTYRLQQLVRQENQERHQRLQEIYENRRLNLQEKKEIFEETLKMYGMEHTHARTQGDMTDQHLSILQNQMRIQRDLFKIQLATHNQLSKFMTETEPGKAWREQVMAETSKKGSLTRGRKIDPSRSNEDLAYAEEILPYETFLSTYKPAVQTPAQPQPQQSQQKPGLQTKKQPRQLPPLQERMDSWLEKFRGG